MLARIRKAMDEKDEGFTLIELLVVIIIIGILAAIAIPVFLNQRKKGYDAQTKSDVKNASTALETYATDYNGLYPTGPSGAAITSKKFDGVDVPGLTSVQSTNDTSLIFSDTSATTSSAAGNAAYTILGVSSSGNEFCYDSTNSSKGVYKVSGTTKAIADCGGATLS